MNDRNENIANAVDRAVGEAGTGRDKVVPVLEAVQKQLNYVPRAALARICETTEITPAQIEGVASFYSQFRFEPAGRHNIKVCVGTACHVKGAEQVYDSFCDLLDIPEGCDTDAERVFTVSKVACLGCCMLAPAVQIDDITYGFVTPASVERTLNDFLEEQKLSASAEEQAGPGGRMAGQVSLCLCSSCVAGGAAKVHRELERQIRQLQLAVDVKVTGCTGISYRAPLVRVETSRGQEFIYGMMKPENVRSMLTRHFTPSGIGARLQNRILDLLERTYSDAAREPVTRYFIDLREGPDSEYTSGQFHIATEYSGQMDPLDIDAYISRGGFKALGNCLKRIQPDEIVETIKSSGLRGRGGAGFLTGLKWENVAMSHAGQKYVICNGDEGDPGAFMDRMIVESFPFRVIEGIAIAAYAVGASRGFLYLRSEYPLALDRFSEALEKCRFRGFVGSDALGKGRSLELEIRMGAGAFVCGEETALIRAIEGKRGMPAYRPPFPSESGLWGKPTLINNVETMAMIPWIILKGAEEFASVGTRHSRGAKTFALAGKINRGGLIEVPMGATLRQIIEQIGGGVEDGRALKAVQVGGPSGGCIPASLVDTPVDYEALNEHGSMMGSGGMVVLDETDCMVEVARYFLAFTQKESCGKCTFCRVGTKRMLEILEDLCDGKAADGDLAELERLALQVKQGSLCGLGRSAPNPVLSTLRHFRDEYQAHIDGHCPAGKCKALIRYRITDECIGCTRCAQNCPADAIEMKPYEQHEIDDEKCIRCDTCRQVCPVDAIVVEGRG